MFKTSAIRFCILFTVVAHAAMAQAQTTQPLPPRTITVTGTSEVEVIPDQAVVTVSVSTFEKDINEGKMRHDQRSKELQDIALKQGVRLTDIQSGRVMIWTERTDKGKPKNVRLSSTITFRIRDLSHYDELLSGFVNAGVESISATDFSVADEAKYKAQARLIAVRAAREQAEAMAGALGQRIGNPLSVAEERRDPPIMLQPYYSYPRITSTIEVTDRFEEHARRRQTDLQPQTEAIASGQIVFRMRISVTFELI